METKKQVIIILGPQGSGKGTQGKRLAEKLGIPYLEAGQLLRDEAALNTERGNFIRSIIDNAGHLEDTFMNSFMGDKLRDAYKKFGGFLLDGYPRSNGQADGVEAVARPTHVLLVDIPDEESIRRLSARWQCPKDKRIYNLITEPPKNDLECDDCGTKLVQRADDTAEGIQKRLDWYHRDTKPLIERYEKQGVLHRIDGTPDIPEVEKLVWKIFS